MDIQQIISILPQESPAERARMRENARKWLCLDDPAKNKAATQLIEAIDQREYQEQEDTDAEMRAMTELRRIERAFTQIPPTETEVKVISALLACPGLSSAELSRKLGWKGQIWHTHFGMMCKKREHLLWSAKTSAKRDAQFYCGILAIYDGNASTWLMKQEVAKTLIAMGMGHT